MPLHGRCDEENLFRSWDDVRAYGSKTQNSVRWIDCTDRMCVTQDQWIEIETGHRLSVSERGWVSLCRAVGCDYRTIQWIQSPGLASMVLNDAWCRKKGSRIVVDGNTVVGVVGRTYQQYAHSRMIEKIDANIKEKRGDWTAVQHAWKQIGAKRGIARTVGTELRISIPLQRVTHPASVRGIGGTAKDISWVGLDARNSLAGECALGVGISVLRLVCANGMVLPAASSKFRIRHTGQPGRIDSEFTRVLVSADARGQIELLERLGRTTYCAETLSDDVESIRLIRTILRFLKGGGTWRNRLPLRPGKHKDKHVNVLEALPEKLAGPLSGAVWRSSYRCNATWWDFLNVFTEQAQHCESMAKQLAVEDLAGRLAKRLARASPPLEHAASRIL